MKKFISLALALVMILSLCACGGSKEESKAPESTAPQQSSSAPESQAPEAAFETLENGKLIMSTNAQFPPYEMVADGEGAYKGFEGIDVEIAVALADKLGLELIIDDMEFDAVVGAVGKQNVDIAMSGITITTERLGVINFSDPYYTESIVCVVPTAYTELDSAGTVVDMLNVICAK